MDPRGEGSGQAILLVLLKGHSDFRTQFHTSYPSPPYFSPSSYAKFYSLNTLKILAKTIKLTLVELAPELLIYFCGAICDINTTPRYLATTPLLL